MIVPNKLLEKTEKRYADRTSDRNEIRRKIDSGLLLQADTPERVKKRLQRLGVTRSTATALAGSDATSIPPTINRPDSFALERIFLKSDLMKVNYLELGMQAASSVGRIHIQTSPTNQAGYGTGFMVSPRLLLTNNHVLPSRQVALSSKVEFDFQTGIDGQPRLSVVFNLDADVFFITDADLDYTLVAVGDGGRDRSSLGVFGWNRLIEEEGKVIVGEYVSIIQHPGGEPKQIALRENQLIDVLPNFLHYQTDTAPGSSGSPVFNDQWEVVAIHHSGVPKRDEKGNILAVDGTLWTEQQDEHRIDWLANEGTRISRIVRHVKQQNLSADEKTLRNQLFDAMPNPSQPSKNVPEFTTSSPAIGSDGSVTWTIPLQVSVQLGQPTPPAATTPAPEQPQPQPVAARPREENQELEAALAELEAASSKTYYDAASDESNRDRYYEKILSEANKLNPDELYKELSNLLESTHKTKLSYSPSQHLYPWVDLHPDRQLRSIYSDQTFAPEKLIREDFRIAQLRALRTQEIKLKESTISAKEMDIQLNLLEASLPFNCEHVVPQSWFKKKEPMRGDLHHLFACEVQCNSFRSNYPYFDFPDFEEKVRDRCGKLSEEKFEPSAGKGAVARATLYFMLRYPGEIDKTAREYKEERLATLLDWHKTNPVTEYEKHRNMAIFEKQGNRNPLIDFPDWADKIAFKLGLG